MRRLSIPFYSALRLLVSYVLGILAGNIILLPLSGPLAFALAMGGMVVAAPLFVIALLVLLVFCKHIHKHLLVWSLFAPIIVVASWLMLEYQALYSARGFGPSEYLTTRNVLERAVLAFVCASFASAIFYYWNSRRPLVSADLPAETVHRPV